MRVDVIIPTCRTQPEIADLAAEILATAGLPVRLIPTCEPVCAAKNRNIGLGLADSEVRIMLDDDITGFPDGWARQLVETMATHPECVMVSPQLVRPNGEYGIMMGCQVGRPIGTGSKVVDGPYLLTACIAIRQDRLRFDEQFVGSGWEDNDYCCQQNALHPGCIRMINHDVQVVHRNEMKNQKDQFTANRQYFQAKWGLE